MAGYGFLNIDSKKENKVILRKIVVENKDTTKPPLYFEVGKSASKYFSEWLVSAITFNEQKSIKFQDVIHNVFIQKPNGEEYLWKEIWRDRIVEFDVD